MRFFVEVQLPCLLSWRLTGGEPPWFLEDFRQEGRINLEVFGHHIKTEQMSVYPLACHGLLVAESMTLCCCVQQSFTFLVLNKGMKTF